jgi:hypothetical protein
LRRRYPRAAGAGSGAAARSEDGKGVGDRAGGAVLTAVPPPAHNYRNQSSGLTEICLCFAMPARILMTTRSSTLD